MISPFRILEILICSLVTFLPYVLVTVYPFRNNLRFSQSVTAVFTAFVAVIQLGCDLVVSIALPDYFGIAKLGVLVLDVLFFLLLIRAPFGKKLFSLFCCIAVSLVVSMGSSLLESLLFSEQADLLYRWTDLVTVLAMQVLFMIPYGIVMGKYLAPALNRASRTPFGWLWLLPAMIIVVWLIMGMLTLSDSLVLPITTVLTVVILVICSIVVHNPAFEENPAPRIQKAPKPARQPAPRKEAAPKKEALPKREPKAPGFRRAAEPKAAPAQQSVTEAPVQPRAEAKAADRKPAETVTSPSRLQLLQYDSLMERIAESDQFHRELRRHVDAMAYRLERRQYEKLQLHINSLQEQLSSEVETTYCENRALDSVIAYFNRMAGYCGAQVTANLQIPVNPIVPVKDLMLLLGNLLDKALEDCKKQIGFDRRIFAAIRMNGSALYLTVENTCDSHAQEESTGLITCRQIVERYNGNLELSIVNGVSKATAIMRPADLQASEGSQFHALQLGNLTERIAESDQFHRELRRHVDAMAYRMERRQYEKLQLHVHSLQEQLSSEVQTSYCENAELNSVATYFTRMAGYCGAQVTANLQISNTPVIPTRDLTVMLGNLLDNALTACKKQNDYNRRIFAAIRMNGSALYLNVEGTCDSDIQENGLGLTVCKQIASRHNGHLELSSINGICKATAVLRP